MKKSVERFVDKHIDEEMVESGNLLEAVDILTERLMKENWARQMDERSEEGVIRRYVGECVADHHAEITNL